MVSIGPFVTQHHMSQDYWENRYQTKDMPWEKGEASPGLVDFIAAHPDQPRGSVLVPGCGTGHDARVWAKAGFVVTGYDLAPSAMRLAREKTVAAGLSAQFALGNFLLDEPPQKFDWIFEHTLFCAIDPKDRELRSRLTEYRRGLCLVRDLDGRVDEVQLDLVPAHLVDVLDSTPKAAGA